MNMKCTALYVHYLVEYLDDEGVKIELNYYIKQYRT